MSSLSRTEYVLAFFFLLAFLGGVFSLTSWAPPRDFPDEKTIRIERGLSIGEAGAVLDESGIIRSSFWFKVFSTLARSEGGIVAGDYYFKHPESVTSVSFRVSHGQHGLETVRTTIPEGLSVFQMAPLLEGRFSLFDAETFVANAREGYLFPDTYFFLVNATASDIIQRMEEHFVEQTADLEQAAITEGKSWEDIVTMASIIEEEAKHEDDRAIISGILWKRIEIGMALQVDATFSYVNGKNSYTLTLEDLEDDSPYNTYEYTGLPPTPIANPGLASLEAALYPEESEYLYFLSDLDGNMYYAEDFDGHQRNRELYLRR
jgi:UPF0755 protein